MSHTIKLSEANPGDRGLITEVGEHCHHQDHTAELERRLLELGFIEGARIEVLHEGLLGGDPVAVKVNDMRVALRRREAASIAVALETI